MKVVVVSIESDRHFDDEQKSYLPLMCEIFGVFSSISKAQDSVSEYFSTEKYELTDWDKQGARFLLKDKTFGGYAFYDITYWYKTLDN